MGLYCYAVAPLGAAGWVLSTSFQAAISFTLKQYFLSETSERSTTGGITGGFYCFAVGQALQAPGFCPSDRLRGFASSRGQGGISLYFTGDTLKKQNKTETQKSQKKRVCIENMVWHVGGQEARRRGVAWEQPSRLGIVGIQGYDEGPLGATSVL